MTDSDQTFEIAERLVLLAVSDPENYGQTYEQAMAEAQQLENNGWKKMAGQTQHQKILKHLEKAGSITVREALVEYSIHSLPKRIQELRELGHAIVSKPKRHPITGQKYVRYSFT